MLVLSRRIGEAIYVGDDIVIKVVDIDRNKVRIGIEAPKSVPIARDDIKKTNKPKGKDNNGRR